MSRHVYVVSYGMPYDAYEIDSVWTKEKEARSRSKELEKSERLISSYVLTVELNKKEGAYE